MYDAIYDRSALKEIKERFPDVVWEDASDQIHPDRISVTIECTEEEWWKFCIESGVGQVSLSFQIACRDSETVDRILALCEEIKNG